MPAQRSIPQPSVTALHRMRQVEAAAYGRTQRGEAVAATSAVMLALFEAGWTAVEIAGAAGLNAPTARARIGKARRAGRSTAGLVVPTPPAMSSPRTPPDQRSWLSIQEAATFAGVQPGTVRKWRAAGLLPKTSVINSRVNRYAKSDLRRIMAAPRYHGTGADAAVVRAQIVDEQRRPQRHH